MRWSHSCLNVVAVQERSSSSSSRFRTWATQARKKACVPAAHAPNVSKTSGENCISAASQIATYFTPFLRLALFPGRPGNVGGLGAISGCAGAGDTGVRGQVCAIVTPVENHLVRNVPARGCAKQRREIHNARHIIACPGHGMQMPHHAVMRGDAVTSSPAGEVVVPTVIYRGTACTLAPSKRQTLGES